MECNFVCHIYDALILYSYIHNNYVETKCPSTNFKLTHKFFCKNTI